MTLRAVHWHEGMFLWPHHMQVTERFQLRQVYLGDKWCQHYDWGLRALDLDATALANRRFVVRALKGRLRDGTLVSAPEDGIVPPLDLKPGLERSASVTVFLALPLLRLGANNVPAPPEGPPESEGDRQTEETPRYLLDTQPTEDENIGDNPQPIQVRLFNLKLLLSTESHAGYEVLPIARVMQTGPEEAPQIDVTYIPPVVACDAWGPLYAGILQNVYDFIGRMVDLLANQVLSRGITFDTRHAGAAVRLGQLEALNEAHALLRVLAFAQGIHPLPAYLELCRLVGRLAIFADARRVPELPLYDHDDLGGCFYRLKQILFDLFGEVEMPAYQERPFVGEALRMQVAIEPKWLEPAYQMFVGVRSPLGSEECIDLLTTPGVLDMKIGSSTRVDEIYDRGQSGLRFTHTPLPPQMLPSMPDLIYFQIDRDSQQAEWRNVQQALTLAIRLNQNRVVGTIQGQRTLTIKTRAQNATMQFTLYVVPQEV